MQLEPPNEGFINPNEDLIQTMRRIKPQFITLAQHSPQLIHQFPYLTEFLQTTLISPFGSDETILLTSFQESFDDILNLNIHNLILTKKNNYVQTFGHTIMNNKLVLECFCESHKLLKTSGFRELCVHGHFLIVKTLLYKYSIIIKKQNNFIQVAGPPIYDYLNYAKSSLVLSKKNGRKVQQLLCNDNTMKAYQITRRLIFYHSSMNRVPGLWRHNKYFLGKGCKPLTNGVQQVNNLLLIMLNELKINNLLDIVQKQKLLGVLKIHYDNVRQLTQVKKYKNQTQKMCEGTQFGKLMRNLCNLPENYVVLKKDVQDYKNKTQQQIEQLYNRLYESMTKIENIQKLLRKVINKTIPDELFGIKNKNILKKVVDEWVVMNRFEDYKIDDIMLRIDLSNQEIKWFSASTHPTLKYKKNRRKKIVGWIICFLFRQLFVGLLAANFYITQKHKQGNKIFYYRKQIWMLVSKLSITKFENNNLQQINVTQSGINPRFIINKTLPCGKLRILPKKGTFRPIITFNSKNTISGKKAQQTLNQFLYTAKIILRGLKKILGTQIGYSVFDNFQIFDKYLNYVNRWKSQNRPPVCYFSLDIEKCYDSIDPIRLKKMIQKSDLIKSFYIIHKYIKIFRNKKPILQNDQMVSCFNAKQRITAQSLDQNLFQIDQMDQNCIYVYTGQTSCISRQQIIQKLTSVCRSLVVVYKNKKYRQTFGIPQGLNISGVLCSFYFALVESSVSIQNGLLMRLTDDYIFFAEREEAQAVLDQLMKLPHENSFKFNQAKIKANFKSKYLENVKPTCWMQWIGKSFNLQTLQYFITQETDKQKLRFSMNVNFHQASKPELYNKKFTFITLRNHLKNKLKSLLTNHFNFYFKPQLFTFSNLMLQVRIFMKMSLYKFQPFIQGLRRFNLQNQHKLVYSVYNEALVSFGKFACSLFRQNPFNKEIYNSISRQSLNVLIQYCLVQKKRVFQPYGQILRKKFVQMFMKLQKQNQYFSQKEFNAYFVHQ